MRILFIIGTGGFIGSVARYILSQWMQRVFETTFPIGTLIVNILGSFIIGIIYAFSEKGGILTPEWRMFLAVGLCGGFTTFSSFAYENLSMLGFQQYLYSALYIGASLIFGLLAVYLGNLLIKIF
jgi:fluoride exporter